MNNTVNFVKSIYRRNPKNLKQQDIWIFENAKIHFFKEPHFQRYNSGYFDAFNGIQLIGIFNRILIFIKILTGRKSIIKINNGIWATDKFSFNYFHWFNDVLPSLLYLKHENINYPLLLNGELLNYEYVKESLGYLNIQVTKVDSKNIIEFETIVIPTLTAGAGNQHPIYFNELAKKIIPNKKHRKPNFKIFIHRSEALTRRIYPSRQFIQLMHQYNIMVVDPSKMSWKNQMEMFSNCSHLIAAHGAGLTNMIFMNEKSKILEIRRDDDIINFCFFSMSDILNHQYYYYLAQSKMKKTIMQEDDFHVEMISFEQTLKEFLN